ALSDNPTVRLQSASSRANLLDAVGLARAAVTSPKSRAAFDDVARDLRSGMTLEQSLSKIPDLEPIVLNLVAVGTKAGNLGEMLLLATEILDSRVRRDSEKLGKLAEPIAILVISAIVGLVVVSLVTAMTSIYDVGLT
ncbi:MAG: type II secretion system F family protein, partial [Pseudomonadota bacterium]